MKLPFQEGAYIDREKLTDYLLSATHPVGGSKARYFYSMGFNEDNIQSLEKELLKIAHTEGVIEKKESEFGEKYILDGEISKPTGGTSRICTVWLIDIGKETPRLIMAYPVYKAKT